MAKLHSRPIIVKRRIPNFVEHSAEDLVETTISHFGEIEDIDWVKEMLQEGSTTELVKTEKDEYCDWSHDLILKEGDMGYWIGKVWT